MKRHFGHDPASRGHVSRMLLLRGEYLRKLTVAQRLDVGTGRSKIDSFGIPMPNQYAREEAQKLCKAEAQMQGWHPGQTLPDEAAERGLAMYLELQAILGHAAPLLDAISAYLDTKDLSVIVARAMGYRHDGRDAAQFEAARVRFADRPESIVVDDFDFAPSHFDHELWHLVVALLIDRPQAIVKFASQISDPVVADHLIGIVTSRAGALRIAYDLLMSDSAQGRWIGAAIALQHADTLAHAAWWTRPKSPRIVERRLKSLRKLYEAIWTTIFEQLPFAEDPQLICRIWSKLAFFRQVSDGRTNDWYSQSGLAFLDSVYGWLSTRPAVTIALANPSKSPHDSPMPILAPELLTASPPVLSDEEAIAIAESASAPFWETFTSRSEYSVPISLENFRDEYSTYVNLLRSASERLGDAWLWDKVSTAIRALSLADGTTWKPNFEGRLKRGQLRVIAVSLYMTVRFVRGTLNYEALAKALSALAKIDLVCSAFGSSEPEMKRILRLLSDYPLLTPTHEFLSRRILAEGTRTQLIEAIPQTYFDHHPAEKTRAESLVRRYRGYGS